MTGIKEKVILYRCSKCGRRSTQNMIKVNKCNGECQCRLCLSRGVVFIPEYK